MFNLLKLAAQGRLLTAINRNFNRFAPASPSAFLRGRMVVSGETYRNPNRKLPRREMLAARRVEQRARQGSRYV